MADCKKVIDIIQQGKCPDSQPTGATCLAGNTDKDLSEAWSTVQYVCGEGPKPKGFNPKQNSSSSSSNGGDKQGKMANNSSNSNNGNSGNMVTVKNNGTQKCVIPEGKLGQEIPKSVECSANKWASDTAKGLANLVGNNPQQKQQAYNHLKKKLSGDETKWEKDWYNGMRQFAGLGPANQSS